MSLLKTILRRVAQRVAPPPQEKISEWANNYLYLSPEDSAEQGRYSSARAPYQVGIMDAFCEEDIEEACVMSSAQIGKTLIFKAIIGYYSHRDPSPMLMVQPTVDMGETFSKDRLAPMIRDTPVLTPLYNSAKSRSSNNTILKKNFYGGHITIVGANAPAGLASRPIRIALFDEVGRYEKSAGTEGDPVNLGRMRTVTFRRRKRIGMFSTPGITGKCRIERQWLISDQRRYYVPCPHCNEKHVLKWENRSIIDDDPETMKLSCPQCGGLIDDSHKHWMLSKGEWIKENPKSRIAGFHISGLYSPWISFAQIAREYYASLGNPEQEKTWWNTYLGETYEEIGETTDAGELANRRESYDADTLPEGVLAVTAGVDTQDNRLEIEIVGWGAGEESWGIQYIILNGNPAEQDVWNELDELLATARFTTADGRTLRILACCIDSGGHHVQEVYEYATPRTARNIWAVKGQFGQRPIWPKRPSKSKKYKGHTVRSIGVDTAKDTIYSRWHIPDGKAGYCHFPMSYDDDWFEQATVEQRITKFDNRGNTIRIWQKPSGARNEALDCRVYAYAALQGLKIERRLMLVRRPLTKQEDVVPPPTPKTEPQPIKQAPPPSGASGLRRRAVVQSPYLRRRR